MSYIRNAVSFVNRNVELRAVIIAAALFFAAGTALVVAWAGYSDRIQGGIAEQVIRFHVLANSDSDEDQALKLMVRDKVLAELSGTLDAGAGLAEARETLESSLGDIEAWASEVLRGQGANYPVKASLGSAYFPTRTYRDASLPAGVYETLRLEIGEAEGKNWWCVMFPPLCFVDVVTEWEETPGGELEERLPAESYEVVTDDSPVKIKFKIVEIWQEIKNFFGLNKSS